jgi:hypothetical protein
MNTFETRKILTDTQTLILRGHYEVPEPATNTGWHIEIDEYSIGMHINGIWIETDLLPLINLLNHSGQIDPSDIFMALDEMVLQDLSSTDEPEYKSAEDNMTKICGDLKATFGGTE